ncbi:MAG: hypothetical protein JSW11_03795 [Candidatus Heimdallarchaeota archaeon]|nr:MAG: hypothetical protein JSW11_03795 [Candidatus Heimdallarchaeota archaeon]
MTRSSSILGTVLAIIGFLLPSFILIWTGNESVVMILAAGYFFLWGYYDIDLGWFGSASDSGLHLFNLNWYLDPSNISQGSELIDAYLNSLSTAIYPGNFGDKGLDISGITFGLSLLIIVIAIFLGLVRKEHPKISGLLYVIGAAVGLSSLLLIWNNATNLTFIGGGVEDNFLPVPLGSLLVLIAGIWNLVKS